MSYHTLSGKNGYGYILSNNNRDVIYIGVTEDLIERVWEEYPNLNEAIAREKQLKLARDWKFNLIRKGQLSVILNLFQDLQYEFLNWTY